MAPKWLSTQAALLLAALAVGAFHLAYEVDAAGLAVVVYLACLFQLAWVQSPRFAFYLGLAIGMAGAAVQLAFFFDIFGPAGVALWGIIGLWIALYLLLSRIVVARWPRWGAAWLPVLWLGLEYFRSELYYLKFAWLTPGFALSNPNCLPLATAGVYGFSFLVLCALAALKLGLPRKFAAAACLVPFLAAIPLAQIGSTGPLVVGVQLEGPAEREVLQELDAVLSAVPDLDVIVLSEYTFDGQVPESVRAWCRTAEKHLIVGGKAAADGGRFYDTVFVVSPEGEVVFEQAKSVPIQFFNDGLPAAEQKLWESPWGKIGIAICYDLSYSRVTDRLVELGAEALVIPAMDAESWGGHEHLLHAKVPPVRAREYGIPIFRVASSGISQLVDRQGLVTASAGFPGQGERLAGRLMMGRAGSRPLDRFLAPIAVAAVAGLLLYLGWLRLSHK
jgi:apolipoprotein N-acyltransferase